MPSVTPYLTPSMLLAMPLGISWNTIPDGGSTPEERDAELLNICWRGTHTVDGHCNQPLRADIVTESFIGPWDGRFSMYKNGLVRLMPSRWPVISIVSARCAPATQIPPAWNTIPATSLTTEQHIIGSSGSSLPGAAGGGPAMINLAPGYVSRSQQGWRVEIAYINGWPHCGTTADTVKGVLSLPVDDCTGFQAVAGTLMEPVVAQIYDGANSELVSVSTASALEGPGTLTLTSPTTYAHAQPGRTRKDPLVVSVLPYDVIWATALLCAHQALTRGATSTTVMQMPGAKTGSSTGDTTQADEEAFKLLQPYKRVL